MADEGIKYIIAADDQASQKFLAVKDSVAKTEAQVKSFGGAASKAAGLVGSVASSLGGSELAGYANQIAGMGEKMQGFAAATKFAKAGLVAGLGAGVMAISYNITRAIDDWIFGVKEWRAELEEGIKKAEKQANSLAQIAARQGRNRLRDIEDVENPAERALERAKYEAEVTKEIEEQKQKLKEVNEANKELNNTWANTFGFAEDAKKASEAAVKIEEDRLKALQDQSRAIKDQAKDEERSGRKEQIQAEANAAKERQAAEAAYWKEQADAFAEQQKKEQEIAGQRRKNYEDRITAERKLRKEQIDGANAAYANTLKGMQLELTEMTKGQAFANAMRFEAEGMSKSAASDLAGLVDEFEKIKGMGKAGPTSNAAMESRTLSGRSSGTNPQAEQVAQLKALNAIQAKVEKRMAEQQKTLETVARNTQIMFEVLGQ